MKTVSPKPLSLEGFSRFGEFGDFLAPRGDFLGDTTIQFYRDMNLQRLGGNTAVSFSTCVCHPRPFVITAAEYHSKTGEGLFFLDEDALFFVAPATPVGAPFPADKVEVFEVPRGTGLILKPGVWHHAPFATTSKAAHVLVSLPERTYANDTHFEELSPEDQVAIARA